MSLREMVVICFVKGRNRIRLIVYLSISKILMYSKRIFFILSSLPFLALLIGYSATCIYMNQGTIITPNLLGIELLHAVEVLAPAKLNIRALGNKIEPDLPVGTILHQHPIAGTSIKGNQTIFVVTSQRPESIKMPSIIGLSKEAADELITPLGIRKKIVYTTSTHPAGTCFTQFPGPESSLAGCELIIALIAQNNRPMLWPDVRGLSAYETAELLSMENIPCTTTHQELMNPGHICLHNCIVVQQRPAAGTIFVKNGKQSPSLELEVIFR